jgi:hypothetical protein
LPDVDDVSKDVAIRLTAAPTGTFNIKALADTTEVAASVRIVETGQTGTTPCTIQVAPGTYTIHGEYADQVDEETHTIEAGQTVNVTLEFIVPEPTQPYRLSISASSLNVKVGDPVTFSGKLEKQCPDGRWIGPNIDCATGQMRPDPNLFSVWVLYGYPDQHETKTDKYGNFSITFAMTTTGDFEVRARAYVPWGQPTYPTAKDGTLHVEPGVAPTYRAELSQVINYCDLKIPQLQLKGRLYQDNMGGPSGKWVEVVVDGDPKAYGSSTTADGYFNFYYQYPPKGTHKISVRIYVDKYYYSNEIQYTCSY